MLKNEAQKPSLKRLPAGGRKAISLSPEAVVKTSYLPSGQRTPLVVRPGVEGLDLAEWAASNLGFLETELQRHGAILFRDFGVEAVAGFTKFTRSVAPELLEYYERTVHRKVIDDKVYTASEYPAEHPIPMHNEYSFAHVWPLKLWFYCVRPAARGGETTLADSRRVYEMIPPDVRERFITKRVMYARNYGEGLDLGWEDVFQTSDRAEVEQYCREAGIPWEWKDGNRLRTRQVRDAVARHPRTGETVWFNQVHLFHVSSLEEGARRSLLTLFREEDLPRHAFYGDGSPIEPEALEAVREAYRRATVRVAWERGDVLMMDNMLVAHGREPFEGERTILVAMAERFENRDA
ncbi:MAG TPA: TauD/TfdA family dioxygenase [Pyrinomonadaceae bacterium]|nr:TauD/TfdA family dioxygenase [Pyrinomonadaceae bacterium]